MEQMKTITDMLVNSIPTGKVDYSIAVNYIIVTDILSGKKALYPCHDAIGQIDYHKTHYNHRNYINVQNVNKETVKINADQCTLIENWEDILSVLNDTPKESLTDFLEYLNPLNWSDPGTIGIMSSSIEYAYIRLCIMLILKKKNNKG